MFTKIIGETGGNQDAVSMWTLLTESLSTFGQHFLADYQAYCNLETMTPPCDLVKLSHNDTIPIAMTKMEKMIRHITTNCITGFGYRWFDAFNRLAFLTDHPNIDDWTTETPKYHPSKQLSNMPEHSAMSDLSFESVTSMVTTKRATPTTQTSQTQCPWSAQSKKRRGCQVKYLEECNLHLFEDALENKPVRSTYGCDFGNAVSQMSSIFDYLVALAANRGTFENHCASTKNYVQCSLLTINADNDKVFKPLTYIRKMRGIARKLTGDCDSSHRDEIAMMFKHVWASIKICGPNQTDYLMVGERSLTMGSAPKEPEFNLDLEDSRSKDFCHIVGYQNRNMKTFSKRVGNAVEPGRAVTLFAEISAAISHLGSKVTSMPYEVCFLDGREGNRIPCEMAFFPKNEQACQLAHRVETVITYLRERCAVLLQNKDVSKKLVELHEATRPVNTTCPTMGAPMSREIRRKMIDLTDE